jgi:hypothetical protein
MPFPEQLVVLSIISKINYFVAHLNIGLENEVS